MKPIVRWTIGNTNDLGIKCLDLSIKNFTDLYKNNFDYYICYNNVDFEKIQFLKKYNINFLNQKFFKNSLTVFPKNKNPCWKLYPPRINEMTHEFFIDNDLIIYKKIPAIEDFIHNKKTFLITEGLKEKPYGVFKNDCFLKHNLNTGFFAISPNFDFKNKLDNIIVSRRNFSWNTHWDEQGLIAYMIYINNVDYDLLRLDQISIIDCGDTFKANKKIKINYGKFGTHFTKLNQTHNKKLLFLL